MVCLDARVIASIGLVAVLLQTQGCSQSARDDAKIERARHDMWVWNQDARKSYPELVEAGVQLNLDVKSWDDILDTIDEMQVKLQRIYTELMDASSETSSKSSAPTPERVALKGKMFRLVEVTNRLRELRGRCSSEHGRLRSSGGRAKTVVIKEKVVTKEVVLIEKQPAKPEVKDQATQTVDKSDAESVLSDNRDKKSK